MERIDRILSNSDFIKHMQLNEETEKDRLFCKHGLVHALDVARIGYILILEKEIPLEKEIIYAAALLHDLGKYVECEEELSHHQVGADLSESILKDCGFTKQEILWIREAILAHHTKEEDIDYPLKAILYEADKTSRICLACKANPECYWSNKQKNSSIIY